jgi:alpha-tubulin suppressor-like RCC1 family protein
MDFLKTTNLSSDLFKSKDRNGNTPLQLLNNDFKNLIWIPEYINEENHYHLTYRFPRSQTIVDQTGNESQQADTQNPRTENETTQTEIREPSPNANAPATATDESVQSSTSSHNRHQYYQIPWSAKRCGSEVYMWGANNRRQLGLNEYDEITIPSQLLHDHFKLVDSSDSITSILMKPRYKQIEVSKNHSLILTMDGYVFSSGIGSGGRLGNGDDNNNYSHHKIIDFFHDNDKLVKRISISNNHSIALTTENEVYGWGLNSYNQLGFTTATSSKDFRDIFESTPSLILGDLKKNGSLIEGIATSKVHSIAYTKHDVFFWGLNIGQMGIPSTSPDLELKLNDSTFRGEVVASPKKVSLRDDIKLVSTCDTCTLLVTERNDIHLYYQYQHVKLPKLPTRGVSDNHFDVFKPSRLTKPVEIKKIVMKSTNYCVVLLETGDVYTFKINPNNLKTVKYNQVWRAYDQEMVVSDVDTSDDGSIVLCTRNGTVFIKSTQPPIKTKTFAESSLTLAMTKNKFKKVENLNRVVKVSCDARFMSFGFIRDDIDMLPLKLQKNDFFQDINQLSPIYDLELDRKQNQLLRVDHNLNTYISRFLYPNNFGYDGDEEEEEEDGTAHNTTSTEQIDILKKIHQARYDFSTLKREKSSNTYEKLCENNTSRFIDELKSDIAFLVYKYSSKDSAIHKGYDCVITVEQFPDFALGIHKLIFQARSSVFKRIFNQVDTDEIFVDDGFAAKYDRLVNEFHITSNVNIISLLIFVHFIYSNTVLEVWRDSDSSKDSSIRKIKLGYEKLVQTFNIWQSRASQFESGLISLMLQTLEPNTGDVLIKLSDGDIRCDSYVLKTRSAFFETLLSSRWDSPVNSVDFSGLSKFQFNFILQHLYGQNNYSLFEYFKFKFEEADDFVNTLLEFIEIADEMLLFQLKALCQLAISDFISLDNVLILLVQSDYLTASKLFMNCCWYVYNNLEVLLFDNSWKDLPFDIIRKLETQVKFFQNCQKLEFSTENGILNLKMLNNRFENESNSLIALFLNNMPSFNEKFISDAKNCCAFEPLIDLKCSLFNEGAPKKRRNSSKVGTSNEIIKIRASEMTQEKDIPSAIDEEFEVIGKSGKKRPSLTGKQTTQIDTLPETNTKPISKTPTPSFTWASDPSVAIPKTNREPSPTIRGVLASSPKTSSFGISPRSNWAEPSYGSSILNEKEPTVKSAEPGLPFNMNTKTQKSKIGPIIKLSQKERKRLANTNSNGMGSILSTQMDETKSKNPWGSTDSHNNPIESNSSSALSNNYTQIMPLLGSEKPKAKPKLKSPPVNISPTAKTNPILIAYSETSSRCSDVMGSSYSETSSLTEVMIQESLRLEQLRANELEKKTLQEIQQEEEFAKWWHEESMKVQKQMTSLSKSSSIPGSKTKHKNKPKHKKGSEAIANDKNEKLVKETPGSTKNHYKPRNRKINNKSKTKLDNDSNI